MSELAPAGTAVSKSPRVALYSQGRLQQRNARGPVPAGQVGWPCPRPGHKLTLQVAVMEEPCPTGKGHRDGQGAASPCLEQRGEIATCEHVGRAKGASAEQASLSVQYFCARGFLFLSSFYLHPFLKKQQMKEATTHIKPLSSALKQMFLASWFALKEPVAK